MSDPKEKQYGLIIPNKNKPIPGLNANRTTLGQVVKKPSIFESDSDSDGSSGPTNKPTGISQGLRRQDKLVQEQAIEEDPTIFQYDELYDEMAEKRKESKLSRKDLDKKPKYISRLIKAAEKRKLENERRIERQVQREREAEGNEFQDKESFVTSAYKKKLEEMKEQEELEKREEYLEAIGDVTKQGNLDGFYRHLYEQKVNYDEDKEKKMEGIKTNVKNEVMEKSNSDNTSDKDAKLENGEKLVETVEKQKPQGKRQYRKKRESKAEDSSEDEEINTKQSHLPSNLDADSDFSIDSSSSDSENDSENVKSDAGEPKEKKKKKDTKEDKNEENFDNKDLKSTIKEEDKDKKIENQGDNKSSNGFIKPDVPEDKKTKPRVDIWRKRTVGSVYDAALLRYYERKSLREPG